MTKLDICARTVSLLIAMPILLRTFNLKRILKMLDKGKKSDSKTGDTEAIRSVNSVVDFNVFGFKVFFPNCLKKSLVIFHILKKMDVNVKFVWGVKKQGADMSAHSWVEKDGIPVYAEPVDIREYHRIYSY